MSPGSFRRSGSIVTWRRSAPRSCPTLPACWSGCSQRVGGGHSPPCTRLGRGAGVGWRVLACGQGARGGLRGAKARFASGLLRGTACAEGLASGRAQEVGLQTRVHLVRWRDLSWSVLPAPPLKGGNGILKRRPNAFDGGGVDGPWIEVEVEAGHVFAEDLDLPPRFVQHAFND